MAVSRWKAAGAGKWSKATEWTPETVPTASIDAEFTAAASGECKVEGASRQCRQLVMTGFTGTLKVAGFPLEVGGSATGEVEANVAARFAGTLASTSGELRFVSTVTTTAQQIFTGSKTIPWKIKFTTAGKWQLGDAFVFTEPVRIEAGTLLGNAQTIESNAAVTNPEFSVLGTGSVDLKGCTLRLASSLLGWNWSSSGELTTDASTVFEIGNAEHPTSQFGGAGLTYNGTVKWIGRECHVDSAGGQVVNILELANKGTGEKGIQVKQGSPTTFTTLTTNGTEAERARIESNEAAKPWKLKHVGDYEPANSFLAVKDCTFEGGVLYLPHGEDLGGNTGIKFEAKPGGEAVQVVGAAKAKSAAAGALSPLMEAAGASKARATDSLLTATILNASGATQARFRTVGAVGALQGLTGAAKAKSRTVGASTQTQSATGATKARTVARLSLSAGGLIQIQGTTRATSRAQLTLAGAKPHLPGISSPGQRVALSAPRQRAGVSTPTQRTGDG